MKRFLSLTLSFLILSFVIMPAYVNAAVDPKPLYDAIEEIEALDYDGTYAEITQKARQVAQSSNLNYAMLGEQMDIFEGIRLEFREKLNQLLNEADIRGMFDADNEKYALTVECEKIWKDENKSATEYFNAYTRLLTAVVTEDLDPEVLDLINNINYWQYNYVSGADKLFEAAINSVLGDYATGKIELSEIENEILRRIEEVPILKTYRVGNGTAFDGWTTQLVQNVVNKSTSVCSSIGTGLNTRNVYNGGDFSNNTLFTAGDGWFAMEATGDFTNKGMGWKNMDRSGSITGTPMAATPVLGMHDLQNAEGIRFKLEMSEGGSVERILIGLSNCCTMVIESYAMNIKPEYVDPFGYINIPFSYFENAWWAGTDYNSNRDKTIVFIVEAYGVSQGTELKFSDMQGYTTVRPNVPATQQQIELLQDAVSGLMELELDDNEQFFADYYKLATNAMSEGMKYDVEDATKAINDVLSSYQNRAVVKDALVSLIKADTDGYVSDIIENYKKTYYNPAASDDDLKAVASGCKEYKELLSYPAPQIIGIEDGKEYDLRLGVIPCVDWDYGEATLNGESCEKKTSIDKPGQYTLSVTYYLKTVTVSFSVSDTSTVPVIYGVEDFGIYDLKVQNPIVITWDSGNGTLNGEIFLSGSGIDTVGEYELKVINGTKSKEVYFSVMDTTPVPVIIGAENGKEYDVYKGETVSVSWTPAEATATLNGESYIAGTEIKEVGEYKLSVTNGTKTKEINFALIDTATVPQVQGVENGKEYDIYVGDAPTVTWDLGTATLDGEPYASGTPIDAIGSHTLVVVNGSKSIEITFTVIDTATVPIISGIEEGKEYDIYTGEKPSATWDVGEATLNGEAYIAGTEIDTVGEYTLTVVNGSKTASISFKVVDSRPPYTVGDFDDDGQITVADALAALRIAAKLTEETETAILIGDIDKDESVTVADALAILRVAAKLTENL